jgi:hypothetical protein
VPLVIPVTVKLVPVPDVETFPGLLINVHEPDDGNPLSTTLPVGELQVGVVIAPTTGALGGLAWAFITTFPDEADVHPTEFVTLKEYVPEVNPETVVPVPEPVEEISPGVRTSIQVPEDGRPVSTTLPVASAQVG